MCVQRGQSSQLSPKTVAREVMAVVERTVVRKAELAPELAPVSTVCRIPRVFGTVRVGTRCFEFLYSNVTQCTCRMCTVL